MREANRASLLASVGIYGDPSRELRRLSGPLLSYGYATENHAGPHSSPAAIDPIFAKVDLCDFRASCQCGGSFRCLLAGLPAVVTIDRDCRRCPIATEADT